MSRYHSSGTKSIYSDKKDDDDKKPYDGVIGNGQAAAALGKQLNQSKGIRTLELQHQNLTAHAATRADGRGKKRDVVRFCSRLQRCPKFQNERRRHAIVVFFFRLADGDAKSCSKFCAKRSFEMNERKIPCVSKISAAQVILLAS